MNGSGLRSLSRARDGPAPCRMAPDMSIKRFFAETLDGSCFEPEHAYWDKK